MKKIDFCIMENYTVTVIAILLLSTAWMPSLAQLPLLDPDTANSLKKTKQVGVPPTDALMIAKFKARHTCFEDIIQAARSEKNVSSIAMGFVQLSDDRNPTAAKRREFLPDERWSRYKRLFSCAGIDGIPGGISLGLNSIYLQAATWGLAGSGGEKGYVWTQTPIAPLVDSLDRLSTAQQRSSPGQFFRHIEGSWYLMIDWD